METKTFREYLQDGGVRGRIFLSSVLDLSRTTPYRVSQITIEGFVTITYAKDNKLVHSSLCLYECLGDPEFVKEPARVSEGQLAGKLTS
jgi:hypothetical protein